MPINPDGSEHWDKCSEGRTRKAIANGKIFEPIISEWMRGINYIETPCDCLPWVGCDKCAPHLATDDAASVRNYASEQFELAICRRKKDRRTRVETR